LLKESIHRQQEATPVTIEGGANAIPLFLLNTNKKNKVNNYDMMIGRQAACLVTSANTITLIRDRNGDFPWADCTLL
jgi:hypothetical protein